VPVFAVNITNHEERNVPRVKRGTKRRASRAKTLDLASGYFLTKSKLHRSAQEAVERALKFAYTGRKRKKRDFRSLWIVRISAAAREAGLSYSKFMHGLKLAGIELDRKVLAETATADASQFALITAQVKTALEGAGK
jgi:large subunit ribosomal protein L20